MLEDITAPAPRFLLRFLLIDKLLKRHIQRDVNLERGCEIGPGLGDMSHYLLRKKCVSTLDLYEDSETARELLNARFDKSDNVDVKGRFVGTSKNYDLVMCCEVIEHIDDDEHFIKTIYDAVGKDGYFIGSVPCYMKKWQAVDELAGHYRRYEYHELCEKLGAVGFEVNVVECYGFPLINILYPLRQYYYSKKLRGRQEQSKRAATAKSGVSRGLAMLFNKRLVFWVARASFLFQSVPFVSRWGDGYVFVCRKG